MPARPSRDRLPAYYSRLYSRFGSQHWWPGRGPFEVIVGAILTQNTAWKNVEKAIRKLRKAGVLNSAAVNTVSRERLARLVRSSGYYNLKAARLKAFGHFLRTRYGGSVKRMFREDPFVLREELLNISGIGPETADSILLYAGDKPFFVVDAYTRRVFSRHGLIDRKPSYSALQGWITRRLPRNIRIYNEFHALVVRVAKEYCGTKPRCEGCPLEGLLPEKGPVQFD